MVYVRLERIWTDPNGSRHQAGEMVDVDAGTLATLQADGTVTEPGSDDDNGGDDDTEGGGWAGPDSDDPDSDSVKSWAGPTGGSR